MLARKYALTAQQRDKKRSRLQEARLEYLGGNVQFMNTVGQEHNELFDNGNWIVKHPNAESQNTFSLSAQLSSTGGVTLTISA